VNDHRIWVIADTCEGVQPNDRYILWNEFSEPDSPHLSLPSLVRDRREYLRDRVLQVLDDVASHRVAGKTVEEALRLEDGLSMLHMTLVWAKRWGELGVLADVAKMLVLGDLLKAERPTHVVIKLTNKRAASAISTTCARLGIECMRRENDSEPRFLTLRAIRQLVRSMSLSKPQRDTTEFIIADYLFRVDPDQLAAGSFRSGYWGNLPNEIERSGSKITWLHRFTPHPTIPTAWAARRALRNLPRHHLLDQIHGLREAWCVWRTYRRINDLHIDVQQAFIADDCDLWPIFAHDWVESFHGPHPMSLAINLVNLRRILSGTETRTLLYIYENQPWEFALRHFVGRGNRQIAVTHATVRYWDLRYFVGTQSRRHLPGHVAVNSPIARAELLNGGYEVDTLHEVEGLMYQDAPVAEPRTASRDGVLVLGELEVASTQRYLDWVVQTAGSRTITFKPHPLIDVRSFSFSTDRVRLTNESTNHIIPSAEVVVLGASGTAALEAIAVGVPVITVLNPRELDLSVVSNHPLVHVAANEMELRDALNLVPERTDSGEGVFFLDHRLTRWKQLLGLG
jgi:surface carbohydrate biosynthesis protein (TIGR04326 family)